MISDEPLRLSPSSINTFFRCPRLFYYNYILKQKSPPNIHLYKGLFVHKAIENLFKNVRYVNPQEYFDIVIQKWNPPKAILARLDNPEFHYDETVRMLKLFANRFNDKIEMIMLEGKAKDKNHAWNLIKPKLRELKIYDSELHLLGIIDSVETSYDELIYLIDYKTSKLYRHLVPEEYVRQTKIYAYLYLKEFGRIPDFIGVHYLRYGEIFLIPVTQELVDSVREDVSLVREKTISRNIDDYPRCSQSWCDCNYFEEKKS